MLYSGTPGSGKSLHVAKDICNWLVVSRKNVISTVNINLDEVQGVKRDKKGVIKKVKYSRVGKFIYKNIHALTVEFFIAYAEKYHKHGIEAQTLVVIDEAQVVFNPRIQNKERIKWVHFFTEHRHLGFDFIIISPFARLIDRQIRYCFEHDVRHKKCNNYGVVGMLLPFKLFVAVDTWVGANDKAGTEVFIYRRKYGRIYDSYCDADHKDLMLDLKLLNIERSEFVTCTSLWIPPKPIKIPSCYIC